MVASFLWEEGDGPPHHVANEVCRGEVAGCGRSHMMAVAQHRGAVAEDEHLFEAMAHE